MKTFLHVFYTWMLSLFILCNSVVIYEMQACDDCNFKTFVYASVMMIQAFVVALPSFFVAWILLAIITGSRLASNYKIIAWYASALMAGLFNAFIVVFLSSGYSARPEMLAEAWPVYAALFITITIRLRYFLLLIVHANEAKQVVLPSQKNESW